MRVHSDRQLTIINGCCTDQLLADRLPGGQGLDELNDTDIAEMLSSSRFALDSHNQRRSSHQIADEEYRRELAALKTKLADIQAEWADVDLHSSKASGDRRSVGNTSSHADSRQASADLRSTTSADKASAAEAEGAAGAGKAGRGLPEPDQAPAGRPPKGGGSKKKKSQRKGSKAGPVEGVTARGITEERPASAQQECSPAALEQAPGPDTMEGAPAVGQPALGLGAEHPRSAPGQEPQYSIHDDTPVGPPTPAHCNVKSTQGNEQPSPKSKALPLHTHDSEQKQDAGAWGKQAEAPKESSDSIAEAEGPQTSSEQSAAAEPEIVSGQGFSTTDAEQAERFHATVEIPSDPEVEEADESFHDAHSGAESAVSSAAQLLDTGSCRASADGDAKWPFMDAEASSNSGVEEDAEQYFADPEEELPKPPALTNDWSEVNAWRLPKSCVTLVSKEGYRRHIFMHLLSALSLPRTVLLDCSRHQSGLTHHPSKSAPVTSLQSRCRSAAARKRALRWQQRAPPSAQAATGKLLPTARKL